MLLAALPNLEQFVAASILGAVDFSLLLHLSFQNDLQKDGSG